MRFRVCIRTTGMTCILSGVNKIRSYVSLFALYRPSIFAAPSASEALGCGSSLFSCLQVVGRPLRRGKIVFCAIRPDGVQDVFSSFWRLGLEGLAIPFSDRLLSPVWQLFSL